MLEVLEELSVVVLMKRLIEFSGFGETLLILLILGLSLNWN